MTYRLPVFKECHVISAESTDKQDCPHIIETLDPLSSLRPLTSNINHPVVTMETALMEGGGERENATPVCELLDMERSLDDTGGLDSGPEDVLFIRHILNTGKQPVHIVEITATKNTNHIAHTHACTHTHTHTRTLHLPKMASAGMYITLLMYTNSAHAQRMLLFVRCIIL